MHHRYLKNLTLFGLFLACLTSKIYAHNNNSPVTHPVPGVSQKHKTDIKSLMSKAEILYDNKRYKEAFQLYLQAADQGHADAQSNLGVMYEKGRGVEQSYEEAAKWYRKSAEQGYADSQFNLGCMYANGQGVKQSDVEAVKWYRKSADQGHADAQYNLGVMYDFN